MSKVTENLEVISERNEHFKTSAAELNEKPHQLDTRYDLLDKEYNVVKENQKKLVATRTTTTLGEDTEEYIKSLKKPVKKTRRNLCSLLSRPPLKQRGET